RRRRRRGRRRRCSSSRSGSIRRRAAAATHAGRSPTCAGCCSSTSLPCACSCGPRTIRPSPSTTRSGWPASSPIAASSSERHNRCMDELRDRVERFVREHELIPAGGEVTCLVSGGADSTCLWHLLGSLGYRVSALHVNHKLRGADSEEDARFCAEVLGAEVVELDGRGLSEAALREQRRSLAPDRLRATGHTASDQVETIVYRLVSRGAATGIKPQSDDGIVHPLLPLWREETEA